MIKISLLITTYNDPCRLKKTLSHYLGQSPQPFEILVCDDGSGPETKVLIESFAKISKIPIVHVYQEDHGWDAPGVRNLGVIKSSGEYLLMTDGDCIPHPGFIRDHLAAVEKGYFVFGDRLHVVRTYVEEFSTNTFVRMDYILRKKIHKRISAIRNPFEKPVIYAKSSFAQIAPLASLSMACNFGVWKHDFVSVNGFDESYRSWWPEDAECSARLLNSGLKMKKYRQKCLVYHLDHGETSRLCHDEYRFAEQSLLSGKIKTSNGIEERLKMMQSA